MALPISEEYLLPEASVVCPTTALHPSCSGHSCHGRASVVCNKRIVVSQQIYLSCFDTERNSLSRVDVAAIMNKWSVWWFYCSQSGVSYKRLKRKEHGFSIGAGKQSISLAEC